MNSIAINNKNNVIPFKSKKAKIQKQRRLLITSIIIFLSLFIIGSCIKNMYVSYRCSNFIYALDYHLTHWKDKDLRLIKVESFSVLSKVDNTIEIEAYGFGYKKPYNQTYLIVTFTEDSNGRWNLISVVDKNAPVEAETDDTSSD